MFNISAKISRLKNNLRPKSKWKLGEHVIIFIKIGEEIRVDVSHTHPRGSFPDNVVVTCIV